MNRATVNKLIKQAREKRPSVGVIHYVDADRADVQIPGSGVVYKNCVIDGDPSYLKRDQAVALIWYHDSPHVIAPTDEKFLTMADLDLELGKLDLSGDFAWNILLFKSGGLQQNYPADEGGLTQALSAAGTDGIVMIPECTIVGLVTIPVGVHLIGMGENSIIEGRVILEGSGLANLKVDTSVADTNAQAAVYAQNVEEAFIRDCVILAYQGSSGDIYGVLAQNRRALYIYDTRIYADNDGGGNGYGIFLDADDDIKMYGGYLGGSTAPKGE